MAQLLQQFDANQVDPSQSAGQLPVGKKMPVIIESSEVKPTKGNDGGLIQFNLRVTGGEHNGASGPYRCNIYNASAQAVDIAKKQLSALCHVTGVFMLQDTCQLHNIPFLIDVEPQKDNPQYTEVKRVFDVNGNEPGKNGQSQGQQPQQQQPAMQGQSNPVGGFGSNAPQQPQQQPAGAWGNQQPQQPQQPQGGQQNAPAWGQPAQQQQQPAQQPAAWGNTGNTQQQPAATGWQQGQSNGAPAPWGQR